MNIRRAVRGILNEKGDALIMAIVTITVLVLLGIAVITVSMGTLKTNRADAATNDAYYAAESGVSSGLDHLRQEVSRYYAQMMQSGAYTSLFNNFASGIAAGAQASFAEPDFSGGATRTTFSVTGHDSSADVYEFLVSTVSTMADGTQYKVEGRLKVKRVDVSAKSWFIKDAALVVGGTLGNRDNGITIYDNNAYVNKLDYNPAEFWKYVLVNGVSSDIVPEVNNPLEYPGFSDPVISNPKYYLTVNNITIDRYSHPLSAPVSIDTAPNISFTFANGDDIPAGVIRAKGDLTITGGGSIRSDIYCRNLVATGRNLYGNIYAHGDVNLSGGNLYGNLYCDGSVTVSNIGGYGSIISNGSITLSDLTSFSGNIFAAQEIRMTRFRAQGNVIYSRSKITLGDATGSGSTSSILFSGGDIVINNGSGYIEGVVIAKGNVSLGAWTQVHYNAALVEQKLGALKGTFFDPYGGGGSAALDASVFQGQSITAIGRIN